MCYISHITTSHPIALFHYSQSYPTGMIADPHGLCNPGATMVVLHKRLINILTSMVRKLKLATTHV